MHRRLWLSIAMLAIGAGLLVAAGFASPASSSSTPKAKAGTFAKKGGTLRVDETEDIDDIDPSISYGVTDWQIWYATALKLLNYPDAPAPRGSRLVPEAAAGFPKISNGGRTYTFTIRKGLRLSDGSRVTAKNFAFAINRALQKGLQSPAAQFITDPAGTNIVGAAAVNAGNARSASGVRAKGNKLTIRLVKPDASFLAKITMPFFQAMSTKLPLTSPIVNIPGNGLKQLPSGGPYYVASRVPDRSIFVKRNPFYKGKRPHNLAALQFKIGIAEDPGYREVLSGQADYGPIPPTENASLGQRFGVNKSQYRVNPSACTFWWALNTQNDLFKNNVPLRRAVNFAISRAAMTAQSGAYSGQPTDQFLPIGFPGFRNAKLYPLNKPNLTMAKRLARGHLRSGKALVFHTRRAPAPAIYAILQNDLKQIGINADEKVFAGFDIYDAMGTRGSSHDLGNGGWCQDYPDPYDFINVLMYGGNIQADHNNNYAYFNNPAYNRKMERAAKLLGNARLRTYGNLEIDIDKNQAPYATYRAPTTRELFSSRVDPRTIVYSAVYQTTDWAALALK